MRLRAYAVFFGGVKVCKCKFSICFLSFGILNFMSPMMGMSMSQLRPIIIQCHSCQPPPHLHPPPPLKNPNSNHPPTQTQPWIIMHIHNHRRQIILHVSIRPVRWMLGWILKWKWGCIRVIIRVVRGRRSLLCTLVTCFWGRKTGESVWGLFYSHSKSILILKSYNF